MWEEISIAVALVSSVLVIVVLLRLLNLQKAMSEMKNQFEVTSATVTAPTNTLTQVANTLQTNAMNLSTSIAQVNQYVGDIGQQAILRRSERSMRKPKL